MDGILGEQAHKPWRPIIVPLALREATALEHIRAVGVVSVSWFHAIEKRQLLRLANTYVHVNICSAHLLIM